MPSNVEAEPSWPSVADLIEINHVETGLTGEPHGVLSLALLESAWAKPQHRWSYEGEADLVRLAVALMVGVAQNHPFRQGNKRTGFGGALALLDLNGYTLDIGFDRLAMADAFVAVISHRMEEAAFAELLRPHVVEHG